MLRVTHADPSAMVYRHPGGAACGIQQCVQQRPVGDGVRAIAHRLGLTIGTCDRTGIEVVAADDDRGLELTARHHLVEGEPETMPVPEPYPADARREALELDALARHVEPMVQVRIMRDELAHL